MGKYLKVILIFRKHAEPLFFTISLGSMLSYRKPSADSLVHQQEAIAKERSPEAAASPRSVLNRTLSFGGFLGSFSALVNLGSSE